MTPTLTREAVEKMAPGREMDCLVAERVMGWRVQYSPYRFPDGEYEDAGDFQPSTDIAAAWEVVEKMRGTVCAPGAPYAGGEYHNNEDDGPMWDAEFPCADYSVNARALTAPLAICRAALLSTL